MLGKSFSVPLLGLFIGHTLSSPIPRRSVEERHLTKRSTILGPKLDGAYFPDPAILHTDRWWSFATRTIGSSIHIQVAQSWDFDTWTLEYNEDGSQYDALPTLPDWVADSPNTWAPDVSQLADGTFVMYYSASTRSDPSKHCIGAATATDAQGPYLPVGSEPLICPLSEGGAIDASGWQDDDGQRYIVYKVDGNSIGNGVPPLVPTPLQLQLVGPDGYTLSGSPTTLLDHQDSGDDEGVVEAPGLVKKDGTYFLLFSSGCYTTDHYNVNYATASSITGPYTRATTPLIATGADSVVGPGGADVSKDLQYLLFHANSDNGRSLYTAMITVSGTTLSV